MSQHAIAAQIAADAKAAELEAIREEIAGLELELAMARELKDARMIAEVEAELNAAYGAEMAAQQQ